MNLKWLQARERQVIRQYVPDEIILEDQRHVEMCKIHASLDDMASTELESIFSEGEQQGA